MIQSKNKVEKCSNTLIIVFMALYLLSGLSLGVSLLTGNFAEIKEYTKIDCIYDTLNSIIAFAIMGIGLIILNSDKVDLYSNEYATSKQAFNLFFTFNILGAFLELFSMILKYFLYKEFSLYALVVLLVANVPVYILSYLFIRNHNVLSKDNDKRTNIVNLIIVYLLMSGACNIITLLITFIFGKIEFLPFIEREAITIVSAFIILVAYRLTNQQPEMLKDKKIVVEETKTNEIKDAVIVEENEKETNKNIELKNNNKRKQKTKNVEKNKDKKHE